ncbi:MAG: lipid IV(A) 3-deoxy-D-manno-octulosonic acid transferase [Gammaproteobacteria bacterium]|nr:lipid IV(A) 3-deoxy-D-manno-octulosonic acid transferase [Gammaproteobacteria bacterium]
MTRSLYNMLLVLLLPVALLRLLWRSLYNRAYRTRWSERFGFIPHNIPAGAIWIHAVSFGEAQAALPLLAALKRHFPSAPFLVTTTTITGSELIRKQLGETVYHCFMPYDLPSMTGRLIRQVHPRALIVMETEIWPNLFRLCQRHHIPVLMANTRLSEHSAHRYRRAGQLTRDTLRCVSLLAVQTAAEAQRLRALGASTETIRVTGNIKFDLDLPPSLYEEAQALRQQVGEQRPVWIAASTHEGEDALLLQAHQLIRNHLPDALLILVPRHPERFDKVAEMCIAQGFCINRRSMQTPCTRQHDIFVGDTMGELKQFYAASDVAFVGGSLVATGGHNILEPAALSRPVLFGPHMYNFSAASQLLLAAGAARQLPSTARAVASAVTELLADSTLRTRMGEAGARVVAENRGALERTVQLLIPFLDKDQP